MRACALQGVWWCYSSSKKGGGDEVVAPGWDWDIVLELAMGCVTKSCCMHCNWEAVVAAGSSVVAEVSLSLRQFSSCQEV